MKTLKAAALLYDLSERLDIPAEALGSTLVSSVGRGLITVENHRGITDYSPDDLSILTSNGQLNIYGSGLVIKSMNRSTIIIRGKINGMEWL